MKLEKARKWLKGVYECDRNNAIVETYLEHLTTSNVGVVVSSYKGETIYVDDRYAIAFNEKDYLYEVILRDNEFLETLYNSSKETIEQELKEYYND